MPRLPTDVSAQKTHYILLNFSLHKHSFSLLIVVLLLLLLVLVAEFFPLISVVLFTGQSSPHAPIIERTDRRQKPEAANASARKQSDRKRKPEAAKTFHTSSENTFHFSQNLSLHQHCFSLLVVVHLLLHPDFHMVFVLFSGVLLQTCSSSRGMANVKYHSKMVG